MITSIACCTIKPVSVASERGLLAESYFFSMFLSDWTDTIHECYVQVDKMMCIMLKCPDILYSFFSAWSEFIYVWKRSFQAEKEVVSVTYLCVTYTHKALWQTISVKDKIDISVYFTEEVTLFEIRGLLCLCILLPSKLYCCDFGVGSILMCLCILLPTNLYCCDFGVWCIFMLSERNSHVIFLVTPSSPSPSWFCKALRAFKDGRLIITIIIISPSALFRPVVTELVTK